MVLTDKDYNPPKIDFAKTEKKSIEKQEIEKAFTQINRNFKQRNSSFLIFHDWFSRFKFYSSCFARSLFY